MHNGPSKDCSIRTLSTGTMGHSLSVTDSSGSGFSKQSGSDDYERGCRAAERDDSVAESRKPPGALNILLSLGLFFSSQAPHIIETGPRRSAQCWMRLRN